MFRGLYERVGQIKSFVLSCKEGGVKMTSIEKIACVIFLLGGGVKRS